MKTEQEKWKEFGQWMRERREELHLTQPQAGERMGVVRQEWYRLEKGRPTTRKTVIEIAKALEVSEEIALAKAGFRTANQSELEQSKFAALFYRTKELTDAEHKREVEMILQLLDDRVSKLEAEEAKAKKQK